jgi:hypothetical protein
VLSRPAEREPAAEDRAAEAEDVCFVVGAETAVFVFAACRLVFREAAVEDCLTTGRLRAEEEERRLTPVVGVVGELDCEAVVWVLTVLLLVFEYEGLAGVAL